MQRREVQRSTLRAKPSPSKHRATSNQRSFRPKWRPAFSCVPFLGTRRHAAEESLSRFCLSKVFASGYFEHSRSLDRLAILTLSECLRGWPLLSQKCEEVLVNQAAILRMADISVEEYRRFTPAERRRKLRKALGDSPVARSFVKRLTPEFYDDVYGTTRPASARSASTEACRFPCPTSRRPR